MRDPRSECADRCEALAASNRLLGIVTAGHVLDHAECIDGSPVIIVDDGYRQPCPSGIAMLGQVSLGE